MPEIDRAVALLGAFKEKRRRIGEEAYLVVIMEVASLLLKRVASNGVVASRDSDLDAVKLEIEAGKKVLDGLADAESVTTGTYYRVAAEYHKVGVFSCLLPFV
jgi:hypothetical protein